MSPLPFRPHYSILGNVPGTDLYLDTEAYKQVLMLLSHFHIAKGCTFVDVDKTCGLQMLFMGIQLIVV